MRFHNGILTFATEAIPVFPGHFGGTPDDSTKQQLFKATVQRVAIEVSSYCNRRCWFCPNASGKRSERQSYLDESLFLSVMRDLGTIDYGNTLMFHQYNEPLAARHIILRRVSQAKALVPRAVLHIVTNGDYLDKGYLEELEAAGVQAITVSLYDGHEDGPPCAILAMADKLGLASEVTHHRGEHSYTGHISHGSCQITIVVRDLNQAGYDRGGLVNIANRPQRTSPCFAPFIDIDIDYHGNVLPCCNVYCDDERHAPYATGNLHDGNSIFEHYTNRATALWRRRLFQFRPSGAALCLTCSRHEFPMLCTDANIAVLERLRRVND